MKLQVQGHDAYAYTGGKPLDAALPAVVFIHGAMHDHSVWGLQSRALAHHGFAVMAVDLPGHGRSAGPALPNVEAAAQWVVDAIEAAGLQRTAVVGHSMGSLIALEVARRLADAASHLVMVGTAFPMKVPPALLSLALNEPQQAIDRVNALSHASLGAKPSAPAPGFWLRGANRALMRQLQARYAAAGHGNLFHHDFQVCDAYANGLQAAAAVRCPSRLLIGRHDPMTPPPAATGLATALQADVVTLDTGHALMSEAPDAVLEAIRSFITGPVR